MSNDTATNLPIEPIVLTPGGDFTTNTQTEKTSKRGFFATFGILLAGWFFGNLILMAIVSIAAITAVGSTGLITVPAFSNFLFGKPDTKADTLNFEALTAAEEKMKVIDNLKQGQTLEEVVLYEDEANALLTNQLIKDKNFPTTQESLSFRGDQFIFTAKFAQTNAPLRIEGKVDNSGTTANIEIVSAKFGKVNIPNFLAANIIDSNLSRVGLSLSGSEIPAKNILIKDDTLILKEVINPKK